MSHVSNEKKEMTGLYTKLYVAKRTLYNEDLPNIYSHQHDNITDIERPIPKDFKTRNIGQLLRIILRPRHNKHCQKLHPIDKTHATEGNTF